jgi:hypothetical protein
MRLHLATSLTAVAATLTLAGSASAAERFAAPDGNGANPCAQADPCSLTLAAEFAGDGDVVRVLDGTYELPNRLDMLEGGVTMEPAVPGTRPVIRLDSDTNPTIVVSEPDANPKRITIRGFRIENTSDKSDVETHPAVRVNSTATLTDLVVRSRARVLEVVVNDPGATVIEDSQVQQVAGTQRALLLTTGAVPQGTVTGRRLTVDAATGGIGAYVSGVGAELLDSVVRGGEIGVRLDDDTVARRISASGTGVGVIAEGPTTLTDSVATANGENARGIVALAAPTRIRNVTAIASGTGSFGIGNVGAATTARNVIARGDATDLQVGGGTMTVDHSNFRTQSGIADGGANQNADPQFVNAAAGNFRLAPTSPAIDAGLADDVLSATDRDGASRFQLAAPDIGAYEAATKGAPQPGDPAADVTAPGLSALRASGKRRGAAKASFTLGEAATVTVKLQRAKAGKRKGGRCVKPTRKLRKAKSCTRLLSVATAVKTLPAGAATVKLGRKLTAGRYRISVVARDAAGNAAKPSVKGFRIARKAK